MNRFPRYIKFEMSNKQSFTLPHGQAKKLLNSQNQLFAINDENGEWTGETINKAHIVDTQPDWATQDAEISSELLRLDNKIADLSPRRKADAGEIARLKEERARLCLGRPQPSTPLPLVLVDKPPLAHRGQSDVE